MKKHKIGDVVKFKCQRNSKYGCIGKIIGMKTTYFAYRYIIKVIGGKGANFCIFGDCGVGRECSLPSVWCEKNKLPLTKKEKILVWKCLLTGVIGVKHGE